jgi:uncharacterized lipoprotein
MMMKVFSVFFIVLLSACAHSPQQLMIQPEVEIVGERYAQGQAVTVEVIDQRENKVLGNLGGAYPESSVITLADGMESAMVRAVEAHLAAQGFNTQVQQENGALFKLYVESLSYDLPQWWVGKTVKLQAVLKVEVKFGNETYTGRYQTQAEHLLPVTPSQNKNEKLVNAVLTQTLSRVFSDQKLRAFMSNF